MLHHRQLLTGITFGALAFGAAPVQAESPVYPLEVEYTAPKQRELGVIPGQIRFRLLSGAALASLRDDARRAGATWSSQFISEWMSTAYVGVRLSSFGAVPLVPRGEVSNLLGARVGPSFHFRPYRRVDVGAYTDGGFACIDIGREDGNWAPLLGAGVTLDVALGPYIALHLEANSQGGIRSLAGRAQSFWSMSSQLGLGFMF